MGFFDDEVKENAKLARKSLRALRQKYPGIPQRTFARGVYEGVFIFQRDAGVALNQHETELLCDADADFAPFPTIYSRVRAIDADLFGKDNRGVNHGKVVFA